MNTRKILAKMGIAVCWIVGVVFLLGALAIWIQFERNERVRLESGTTWVSDNPHITLVVSDNGDSVSGQIEVDGEILELKYYTCTDVVTLCVVMPGETDHQELLDGVGWMSLGKEKLTIYDIRYLGDFDLGYDKIVLRKQK